MPPFPHFLFPGRRQRAFLWGEKKIRIAHKRKKKKEEEETLNLGISEIVQKKI